MKVNALRELIQRIDGEQVGSLIFKVAPVVQEPLTNLKFTCIRRKKALDAGWLTLNGVMFYPDFVDLKIIIKQLPENRTRARCAVVHEGIKIIRKVANHR